MEREAFRLRMQQYKLARENNPLLKYWDWKEYDNGGTVGELVDAIYATNPKEEFLGEPAHHYDFTISEEEANRLGYFPDKRGHRDDRVKKESHPSHPSRGTWSGDYFSLTDKGMEDPNYTLFGLNDGGLDPQAILRYKDSYVLPEMTITPKDSYIYNSYDNIKLHLPKKYATGGKTEDDKVLWNWDSQLPEVIVLGKKKEYSDERTDHPIKKPKEYPIYRRGNGYITLGKSDDSWKKWDKDGDGTLSPKERWERLKSERRSEDWRNLWKGINGTFGTAAAAASILYGGGWAATRLINGNRASTLGGKLAKHVLSSNAVDTGFDAANMLFDPTDSSNILDLSTGLLLSRYKDFSKPVRQIGELINAGVNTYNAVDNYESGGEIGDDRKQSHSEIPITNFDPKGDPYNPTYGYNPGAGYVSNSDPLGSLYVEGALLNPVFKLAGNAVSNVARGLTKYSSKYVPEVRRTVLDKINSLFRREAEDKARTYKLYDDAIESRNRIIEDLYSNPAYMERARLILNTYGDNYAKVYEDIINLYNTNYWNLPNPVIKQLDAKAKMLAKDAAVNRYITRRQPAGYDDFEYLINRNLTEIDYPTTRHELGHYVDFNLAKSSNPDYSNSMFAELKRDLSKLKNPLFPDKTDYYSKGTELKSYMNTLREYMFKTGMINNIGDKVTSRLIKKAIRSLPKDMRSIEAAYLQFATPGLYTKWFNKIPLLGTYPIVNKQFLNYEEDKDKARKLR